MRCKVQQLNAERGKLEEDIAVISAEVNKMQEWTKENLHGIELPGIKTSRGNCVEYIVQNAIVTLNIDMLFCRWLNS